MVLESGVEFYANSYLSNCVMQKHRVTHAVIESKNGTEAIGGRCFIDATGDGELCYMAGVPMIERKEDLQPVSLCFIISGVNTETDLLKDCIHHNGKNGVWIAWRYVPYCWIVAGKVPRIQKLISLEGNCYVPYESMVSEWFDNLIAAGRCISSEKEPYASIRVQATAMSIGEAAGLIADMHCVTNAPVYDLPADRLKQQIYERHFVL